MDCRECKAKLTFRAEERSVRARPSCLKILWVVVRVKMKYRIEERSAHTAFSTLILSATLHIFYSACCVFLLAWFLGAVISASMQRPCRALHAESDVGSSCDFH